MKELCFTNHAVLGMVRRVRYGIGIEPTTFTLVYLSASTAGLHTIPSQGGS